jgi:hypothetical protein
MPEHEVNGDCTYEEMPCVCHSKKIQSRHCEEEKGNNKIKW